MWDFDGAVLVVVNLATYDGYLETGLIFLSLSRILECFSL